MICCARQQQRLLLSLRTYDEAMSTHSTSLTSSCLVWHVITDSSPQASALPRETASRRARIMSAQVKVCSNVLQWLASTELNAQNLDVESFMADLARDSPTLTHLLKSTPGYATEKQAERSL